jgi:ribosomal protein S18 acetylase RimI-like enzyme
MQVFVWYLLFYFCTTCILSKSQLQVYAMRMDVLASLLLDNLLSYLTSGEQADCKAVYLHVLTTNVTAIRFYERRNFRVHSCLPYYYSIKGCPHDGYSYVLYVNGGQPPSPFLYPFGCFVTYLICVHTCNVHARWAFNLYTLLQFCM